MDIEFNQSSKCEKVIPINYLVAHFRDEYITRANSISHATEAYAANKLFAEFPQAEANALHEELNSAFATMQAALSLQTGGISVVTLSSELPIDEQIRTYAEVIHNSRESSIDPKALQTCARALVVLNQVMVEEDYTEALSQGMPLQ